MHKTFYIKGSNPLRVADYFIKNQFYYDRDGNAYIGLGDDLVELKMIAKSALVDGSITFLSTEVKPGRRISELDVFWNMSEEYIDISNNKYLAEMLYDESRKNNIKSDLVVK